MSARSTDPSKTVTAPEPRVRPAAPHILEGQRNIDRRGRARTTPAAPPSSTVPGDAEDAAPQIARSSSRARAERHLVGTGPARHLPATEKSLVPGLSAVPTSRKAAARAGAEDHRHVVQGLDVVDHGGLTEQSHFGGEGRLRSRLTAETLQGVEQGGLLTADVCPCPPANLHVEPQAASGHIRTEQTAPAPGLLDGVGRPAPLRSGYSPRM